MSDFEQVRDLPNLYIDNLQISRASNTTLTVGSGQCRDNTNVFDIVVEDTSTTINAAANGKNGLDTGALAADTIYYIYCIADATVHNDPAFILSANATGPLMPDGYNIKRKIGIWSTDNSSLLRIGVTKGNSKQRIFYYDGPISVLAAGASTTYADVSLALCVPPIDNTEVYFSGILTGDGANDTAILKPTGDASDVITWNAQVAAVPIYHAFRLLARLASSLPKVSYKVATGATLTLFVESYIYYV